MVDQERKKVCSTKNINGLYILCVLCLSPFVPHCSFSHSYSPVTMQNAILPLRFSHCMTPSTSLSLSHSLFILGFTVSIPKGRSIDCNSLSMKSPLCCWKKETFNRTITLFLCSFWSLPLSPTIYTTSLALCFVLGTRRLFGRQYRQRSEATARVLLGSQWGWRLKDHHTTIFYFWIMQKR